MARDARNGFSRMADRLAASSSQDGGLLVLHPEQYSLDRVGVASSRLCLDRSSDMFVRIEPARFQEKFQRPSISTDLKGRPSIECGAQEPQAE